MDVWSRPSPSRRTRCGRFDIFAIKFIQLDSHPRAPSTRKGTLTEVEMTHWPETLRALAEADDPRLPKTAEVAMHTLMSIRAVIYRLGAINGTAEMRALSLQLQALAFRAEK
jgi:hypothetical protein